jgi:hypothetical protein
MKLNKYQILGIVIFFILLSVILWAHFHSQGGGNGPIYKEGCKKDSDCPSNQECKFDADYKMRMCINKDQRLCTLDDSSDLLECDLDVKDSCNMCINQPQWACKHIPNTEVTITKAGSGYTTTSVSSVSGGSGKGMTVSYTADPKTGAVSDVKVTNMGSQYKIGDNLTIIDPQKKGKDATLSLTKLGKVYKWKQGKNTTVVPPNTDDKKGWCLPDMDTTQVKCNQFTGDIILVKDDIGGGYKWSCYCPNPDMFSNELGGDCNIEHICGKDQNKGELYVLRDDGKECTANDQCTNGYCCLPDTGGGTCSDTDKVPDGVKKHCYIKWSEQPNTDPRDGRCICNDGLKYVGNEQGGNLYSKLCVNDSCQPGGKRDGDVCDCGDGYIGCPQDIHVNQQGRKDKCKDTPMCLPDPCKPYGHYDRTNQICVCTKPDTAPILDQSSPVGYSCVKLCENNGPCGTGSLKRGDCVVTGSGIKSGEACENCICPWCNSGDKDCDPHTDTKLCNALKVKRNLIRGDDCTKPGNNGCCSGNCKYCFNPTIYIKQCDTCD